MSSTSARLCASCGSPLPELPADTRQVKCAFCGVVNDIANAGAPQPIRISIDSPGASRVARNIVLIIAAVIILSVVAPMAMAGLGMYVAWRSVSDATQNVRLSHSGSGTEFDTSAAGTRRSIAPADLAKSAGGGWKTLDVASPSSGWATFEPVADLKWAMAIATAWQPDARLTRIDVSRLTPQGTVNLADAADDSAGYRFESPGQIEAWTRSARQGETDPQVGHELMVKLSQRQVTALVVGGKPSRSDVPSKAPDSLPLGKLLTTARKKPAFAQPSFFDGYMIYNEHEGWVWYLTGRGFDESLPRLRARDASTYPFR